MNTILVYRCKKQNSNVIHSNQFDTNVSQLIRRVIPWSYDPLASIGELSSSSLNRLSVYLSCLFCLCIPPVVYGRYILYLHHLRMVLFSEKKSFCSFFFKKWTPVIQKKTILVSPDVRLTSYVRSTPPDN